MKRFCLSYKTQTFLQFQCILKEMGGRGKFSRQVVTKYIDTFLGSSLVSLVFFQRK